MPAHAAFRSLTLLRELPEDAGAGRAGSWLAASAADACGDMAGVRVRWPELTGTGGGMLLEDYIRLRRTKA
jgi:hypothetical protein